jgi:hypothetical protein
MKRKLLLLLLFALSSTVTFAQRERLDLTYKTAIGVRFTPFGVSLKVNNAYRKRSVEAIAYFQDNTYVGTFLYYWNLTLDKKFTTKHYTTIDKQYFDPMIQGLSDVYKVGTAWNLKVEGGFSCWFALG